MDDQVHNGIEDQHDGDFQLNRYSLFMPKNPEEIMVDYPELREYECFKRMPPRDVSFCWWVSCRSSPIFGWSDSRRKIDFAIKKSYGKLANDKYEKLMSGEFSEDLRDGMGQMQSFRPNARIRINKMNDKILSNWEKVVSKDIPDGFSFDNVNAEKAHVEATEKIRKAMPDLLKDIERNLSIATNHAAKDESDSVGFLDDYHGEKASKKAE